MTMFTVLQEFTLVHFGENSMDCYCKPFVNLCKT